MRIIDDVLSYSDGLPADSDIATLATWFYL